MQVYLLVYALIGLQLLKFAGVVLAVPIVTYFTTRLLFGKKT